MPELLKKLSVYNRRVMRYTIVSLKVGLDDGIAAELSRHIEWKVHERTVVPV